MAVGGLLGSSSPGFPGTHSPGTPDLGGPFPVASLWDGRCFVLYPARDVPFGVGGFPVH